MSDFRSVGLSSNINDDESGDNTMIQSQPIEDATNLAIDLGLKVQKRDRQLDIAKDRIRTLNQWLQDATEQEDRLKAEVGRLKWQQANWRRTSKVVKSVLDSAEAFD